MTGAAPVSAGAHLWEDGRADRPFNPYFMFATAIDSSCPVSGGIRMDQMAKSGHYARWREDIGLVRDLGVRYLRYGAPLHRVYLGAEKYDWGFADDTFADLRCHDLVPIVALCRYGVPDWIGDFQNPDFPGLFASYARAFAERFPWVQLYTPVDEMLVCALFSAKYGWWNEQLSSDRAFVTALKHVVMANVLAMHEILEVRPDALFVQGERAGYAHADQPRSIMPAEFQNSLRFLSLDLNYGHRVDSEMYTYLADNGLTRDEYHFFLRHHLRHHCVLGTDYYTSGERRVCPDATSVAAGEVLGFDGIVRQYQHRYAVPVMHTETSAPEGAAGDEAVHWLWKQWANALHVRNVGVPLVGFTWYALLDSVDWDSWLTEDNGHVEPVGLYDLHRRIRPVGQAYQALIENWRYLLPTQSVCLTVPVLLPSEYDEPMARRRREWMHRFREERKRTLPHQISHKEGS